MKTSTEILSDEHVNILKAIDALLKECDSLESGGTIDKDFLKKTIEFVRGYADKFHHAKEEDILFKLMCKNESQMHCNPTDQMLHEHDLGRKFIKGLEEGVEENDKDKIIENTQGYATLLKEHIAKEDDILYPMADDALSSEDKDKMQKSFVEVDKKMSKEKEKHLDLISDLGK